MHSLLLRNLLLAAACWFSCGLGAEGVTVTNDSPVAWQIHKPPQSGPGHYFAYPQAVPDPGEPPSAVPDWMDIDWSTTAAGRDFLIRPGETYRIDLIGNGQLEELFHIRDAGHRRRATFTVHRDAPAGGRPAPTAIFGLRTGYQAADLFRMEIALGEDRRSLRIRAEEPAELPAVAEPVAPQSPPATGVRLPTSATAP